GLGSPYAPVASAEALKRDAALHVVAPIPVVFIVQKYAVVGNDSGLVCLAGAKAKKACSSRLDGKVVGVIDLDVIVVYIQDLVREKPCLAHQIELIIGLGKDLAS